MTVENEISERFSPMVSADRVAPKITVIMALYKGEQTMRRMVDFILRQTFSNFELILVDDGSPDLCGVIADEYAAKDNRVKVIHKQNEGLAMARNDALQVAWGEYSIQFDQDDWVDDTCLEEMYKIAKEQGTDMVICDHFSNDMYSQKYVIQKPASLDHWKLLANVVTGSIAGYCWNKLIRIQLYKDYHIRFPKEFYGCEDQYGICQLLKNDIKVSYLPKAYYHYVYSGTGSLSRHYDEKTFQNDVLTLEMFKELLKDTPIRDLAKYAKSDRLVFRGFVFGKKLYTSDEFKQKFSPFKNDTLKNRIPLLIRFFYTMSFGGYYQVARRMYEIGYQSKQKIKALRAKI